MTMFGTSSYSHAIMVRLPLSAKSSCNKIDWNRAKHEQRLLSDALRSAGVDLFELAPDNDINSIFIHDAAVVCNGTALLTKSDWCPRHSEVNFSLF